MGFAFCNNSITYYANHLERSKEKQTLQRDVYMSGSNLKPRQPTYMIPLASGLQIAFHSILTLTMIGTRQKSPVKSTSSAGETPVHHRTKHLSIFKMVRRAAPISHVTFRDPLKYGECGRE